MTRSASFWGTACVPLTSEWATVVLLSEASTWWIGVAKWRTPRSASVAYARVISSGETSSVPSVSAQRGLSSVWMPRLFAALTTAWGPVSRPCPSLVISCANTVFTENAVASISRNVPDSSSAEFDSVHGPTCPVSGSVV